MASLIRNLFEKYTSRGVQNALRQLRRELRTQRVHKASIKKAERLSSATKLRLNLAYGPNRKEGCINIDLADAWTCGLTFARDCRFQTTRSKSTIASIFSSI